MTNPTKTNLRKRKKKVVLVHTTRKVKSGRNSTLNLGSEECYWVLDHICQLTWFWLFLGQWERWTLEPQAWGQTFMIRKGIYYTQPSCMRLCPCLRTRTVLYCHIATWNGASLESETAGQTANICSYIAICCRTLILKFTPQSISAYFLCIHQEGWQLYPIPTRNPGLSGHNCGICCLRMNPYPGGPGTIPMHR